MPGGGEEYSIQGCHAVYEIHSPWMKTISAIRGLPGGHLGTTRAPATPYSVRVDAQWMRSGSLASAQFGQELLGTADEKPGLPLAGQPARRLGGGPHLGGRGVAGMQ